MADEAPSRCRVSSWPQLTAVQVRQDLQLMLSKTCEKCICSDASEQRRRRCQRASSKMPRGGRTPLTPTRAGPSPPHSACTSQHVRSASRRKHALGRTAHSKLDTRALAQRFPRLRLCERAPRRELQRQARSHLGKSRPGGNRPCFSFRGHKKARKPSGHGDVAGAGAVGDFQFDPRTMLWISLMTASFLAVSLSLGHSFSWVRGIEWGGFCGQNQNSKIEIGNRSRLAGASFRQSLFWLSFYGEICS